MTIRQATVAEIESAGFTIVDGQPRRPFTRAHYLVEDFRANPSRTNADGERESVPFIALNSDDTIAEFFCEPRRGQSPEPARVARRAAAGPGGDPRLAARAGAVGQRGGGPRPLHDARLAAMGGWRAADAPRHVGTG